MSGFDVGGVSHGLRAVSEQPATHESNLMTATQQKFVNFIREFRLDNNFVYRNQLRQNFVLNQYFLDVDMKHLIAYDEELANQLVNRPTEFIGLFEEAAGIVASQLQVQQENVDVAIPRFQLLFTSEENPTPIRSLNADHITKLVRVPGIIISASMTVAKATRLHLMCRACQNSVFVNVKAGLNGLQLPRTCEGQKGDANKNQINCPMDPFLIVPDTSDCVDQQTLKIQEAPDMVPVGELPRYMLATVDRNLTGIAVPGTRVTLMGIYSIFNNKSTQRTKTGGGVALRQSYLRVVGMQLDTLGSGRSGKPTFTEEEEEEMLRLSRNPEIYDLFAASIAPSIFGFGDVKKAVACLLLGGSRKILPDGMKLRGDINVLLLGDPGTAKSQMLKFVEKVAPIGVYTSGKGSSAAGLTASVVRDAASRDFYLEGGAMVLADGGVVCIDEFDKMREDDRVAIHEAMEQQTISIAKAGITTVLNSRTSVLAAANPVFGRYDDLKTPGENIDFQSTILSRFDMIFIVKDEHNEEDDIRLAKHVLNIHMNATSAEAPTGDIPIHTMKKYISYCKSKCAPRLSPEAAEKLSNHFVTIRSEVRGQEQETNERSSIPITIRQLEAIVRISESLAKITLSPIATEHHVDEAIRLFKVSTLDAVHAGQMMEGMTRPDMVEEVEGIENKIKKRLPRGSRIATTKLVDYFMEQGHNQYAVDKAIGVMLRRDELKHQNGRMYIVRVR